MVKQPLDFPPLRDHTQKLRDTQVFLLQMLVRRQTYPKDETAYNVLAAKGHSWDKTVVVPLSVISGDPLFRVNDDWTATGFQARLVGKPIPKPASSSVDSMLCAHGNRRATWHAILDCGQVTPAQVLVGGMSLVMLILSVTQI